MLGKSHGEKPREKAGIYWREREREERKGREKEGEEERREKKKKFRFRLSSVLTVSSTPSLINSKHP